jgi:hypothetical protein
VGTGLLTYPVLMAADILLYRAALVPAETPFWRSHNNAILHSMLLKTRSCLPRQARDEHRKSSGNEKMVSVCLQVPVGEDQYQHVREHGLFEPFMCKNDHFTKTGSGQKTRGSTQKQTTVLAGGADARHCTQLQQALQEGVSSTGCATRGQVN